MGLALGALGVLSFNSNDGIPFILAPYRSLFGHPNFKSLALLVTLTFLICLVAYLTNPTEASFRTFLTELSFRHHLTRLNATSNIPSTDACATLNNNDHPDNGIVELGNHSHPLGIGLGISTRKSDPSSRTRSGSNPSVIGHNAVDYSSSQVSANNHHIAGSERRFQFSSKASVSLRTPTHVYRSFGLLTIAVVSPLTPVPPVTGPGLLGAVSSVGPHPEPASTSSPNGTANTSTSILPNKEATPKSEIQSLPPIAGTWYIGIFGTWFTGGRVVQRRTSSHSSTSVALSTANAASSGSAAGTATGKKARSRASRFTANLSETVANFAMGSSGANAGGTTTLSLRSRKGEEVGVIVPSRGTRFGLIKFEGDDEESVEGPTRNPLTSSKTLRRQSTSRTNLHQSAHGNNRSQNAKGDPAFVPRTSSPPPLPKSASLPLHTKGGKGSAISQIPVVAVSTVETPREDPQTIPSEWSQQQQQYLQQPPTHRPLSRVSSMSSLHESSPVISDLMAQLSKSQNGVAEMRSQLAAFEATAASNKSALEDAVEAQRTKKRNEDTMRTELRSKIRALEEDRRSAESQKREKDKNLQHAKSRKREVERRLEKLTTEISTFKEAIEFRHQKKEMNEQHLQDALVEQEEKVENTKREIEVAEKLLNSLNERVKSVEEEIEEEKAKIASLKEAKMPVEEPTERRDSLEGALEQEEPLAPWPPGLPTPQSSPTLAKAAPVVTPVEKINENDISPPSKPRHLSLGGISNLASRSVTAASTMPTHVPMPVTAPPPAPSHSTQSSVSSFYSRFSPFDIEQDSNQLSPGTSLTSPTSPGTSVSFIPSGIMESPAALDSDEMFVPHHESPIMEDDGGHYDAYKPPEITVPELRFNYSSNSPDSTSPVATNPYQQRYDHFEAQRAAIKNSSQIDLSDYAHESYATPPDDRTDSGSIKSKRWFSKDRGHRDPPRGLNPDAKTFKFTRKSSFLGLHHSSTNGTSEHLEPAPGPIDPLNPSGPPPMPPPPTPRTSFFSSLRAFQPSPAEREALRLAMASSANNSLERINSNMGPSYSPPATNAPAHLMHNPFGANLLARTSNPHVHLLQGQGQPNPGIGGGYGGTRNPWLHSSHGASNSLDAVAAATFGSAAGSDPSNDNSSFSTVPAHKKTFSFNPWGGDKLLGNK